MISQFISEIDLIFSNTLAPDSYNYNVPEKSPFMMTLTSLDSYNYHVPEKSLYDDPHLAVDIKNVHKGAVITRGQKPLFKTR